uniref:Uncharacterized protein n=1 Tax=Arundo donax TaxID=35708 RepID=A0A0A9F9S3_ARUDO
MVRTLPLLPHALLMLRSPLIGAGSTGFAVDFVGVRAAFVFRAVVVEDSGSMLQI